MEDKQKTQMDVVVHKASTPMGKNETLQDFTMALSAAGREHIKQKQSLAPKDDVFATEIFGDSVVMCVYYDTSMQNPPKVYSRYFRMDYTRDSNGKFSFGKAVEVKRVTRFEPVVDIAKNANAQHFAPAVIDEETSKRAWTPLWSGVL